MNKLDKLIVDREILFHAYVDQLNKTTKDYIEGKINKKSEQLRRKILTEQYVKDVSPIDIKIRTLAFETVKK